MKPVRLLPVVVLAIAALLVLKTIGLATNGGYVLTGVGVAQAAGETGEHAAPAEGEGEAEFTLPPEPTMSDTSPTMADVSPTLGESDVAAEHGAPAAEAEGEHGEAAPAEAGHEAPVEAGHEAPAAEAGHEAVAEAPGIASAAEHGAPAGGETGALDPNCVVLPQEEDALAEGEAEAEVAGAEAAFEEDVASLAAAMRESGCDPRAEGVPMQLDSSGRPVPLTTDDGGSLTERALLERLAARRTELDTFEQELALRASLVDAAERRIEERATTLEALEAQIAALVDQRQEMESGQFAGIVAMYETMKPKDAATIFDQLDMEVLLRVAKTMSPRKMAPILAEMAAERAQELTVRMAALSDQPAAEMTPDDLAALPQIVGE